MSAPACTVMQLVKASDPGARANTASCPDCAYCTEPILSTDPEPFINAAREAFHRECIVRAVLGSAAHQLEECSCFGGTRHDPPGLTLRESARFALETFEALHERRDETEKASA